MTRNQAEPELGGEEVKAPYWYVVYSGIQAQQPVGTAFKMTPDPSNIWSWHHTVTVKALSTVTVPVVIDFDTNGKMDTEYAFARVLITDMQVRSGWVPTSVLLLDNKGVRWDLTPSLRYYWSRADPGPVPAVFHLSTPLSLPVGSSLSVQVKTQAKADTFTINLIGRLVTL